MRHCNWRVFGIPTPLCGVLHTVASQHITTLHYALGRHILRCEPAQVKHHFFATEFLALNWSKLWPARNAANGRECDATTTNSLARQLSRARDIARFSATSDDSVMHVP